MTSGEIIGLIVSIFSIIMGTGVSLFTVRYFNNKGLIYEIKKNAILRSLRLIDDYMSNAEWKNKNEKPIQKKSLSIEYLTVEARECYNELILTVKSHELVKEFNRIVFSTYYNKEGMFNSNQMQKYRLLCRKELGMKKIELADQITFINRVGNFSNPRCEVTNEQ